MKIKWWNLNISFFSADGAREVDVPYEQAETFQIDKGGFLKNLNLLNAAYEAAKILDLESYSKASEYGIVIKDPETSKLHLYRIRVDKIPKPMITHEPVEVFPEEITFK